ncbi:MAG TPA: hypothetical protein VGO62_16960 [Myxococcota bacterium]
MRMRPAVLLAALAMALVATLGAGRASATVVSVPSLEEMAAASPIIADVTVLDETVMKDDQKRILTRTRVVVNDGWRGSKRGAVLTLWQVGGSIGGKSAWIVGATHWNAGEHMVFFGGHHDGGAADEVVPFGIGLGTFDIVDDGVHKDGAVIENLGDVVDMDGTAPHARNYSSLSSFKQAVLAAVAVREVPGVQLKHKLAPSLRGARGAK